VIIMKPNTALTTIQSNPHFAKLFEARKSHAEALDIVLRHFVKNPKESEAVLENLDVSEATHKDYAYRIKSFLEFIGEQVIDLDLFLKYKKHLQSLKSIKVSTKNKHLVAARIFIKELARQAFIKDITLNIKTFNRSTKHKKTGHTLEQVKLFMAKIAAIKDVKKRVRIDAIFRLAALEGLREIELCRLDIEDLDLKANTIYIHGKKRDDKEAFYISDSAKDSLQRYIDKWKLASGPLIFSTSNNVPGRRMSTRSLRRLYNSIKAGTSIEATMHGFRHFNTTHQIKSGIPITMVQKKLRHKSLNTTQIYNDEIVEKEDSKTIADKCFKDI